MVKEKSNNQNKLSKDGYLIIPNYFFRKWIRILGAGPAILYLELLTYCHKEKDMAWPTINSLCQKMGVSKNSLIKYREVLLTYGLIKKMIRRKSIGGDYQVNFYQLTSLEDANIEPGVVQKLHLDGAKIKPQKVQNLNPGGANIEPGVVQKLNPNNNNTKHYQVNNNKEVGKDTAVVDFNKSKEKGEERMRGIIEQLADLSFEERFIEQILKDFSLEKIEEKLELLMVKRNIQNPAGWLRAALKNNYQGPEHEKHDEELVGQTPPLSRIDSHFRGNDIIPKVIASSDSSERGNLKGRGLIYQTNTPEQVSREKALKGIRLIRKNLSLPVYPLSPRGKL